MNPNVAAAPAPKNLMHDIVPPKSAQTVQPALAAIPVAQQAMPAAHPISGQLPQVHMQAAAQAATARIAPKPVPAKSAQAARAAHQPKEHPPILAISAAVVFAVVMIAAAFMAYRQS